MMTEYAARDRTNWYCAYVCWSAYESNQFKKHPSQHLFELDGIRGTKLGNEVAMRINEDTNGESNAKGDTLGGY